MSNTLVMKFGGTSLGSAEAIRQAGTLTRKACANWPRVVVVVSAMSSVTNTLLEAAYTAAEGNGERYQVITQQLLEKHLDIINALLTTPEEREQVGQRTEAHLGEFRSLCHAVHVLGEASPRALDAISSLGESIASHIVSAHLREDDCPAVAVRSTELIRTDKVFQSASPEMDVTRVLTRKRLGHVLSSGKVPIVTGFIAATEDGATTTLGRGGSDFTTAIIAACLDADEVWIWTDVDGVMTADPRIVPNARTLEEVSYQEIGELAYAGARVIHPKTIGPVMESSIALWIKNTFNPDGPATQVKANNKSQAVSPTISTSRANTTLRKQPIRAVTAIRDQSLITIQGRGMIGVQGIAARTFASVARTYTSVALITQASSEQSICFAVPDSSVNPVITSLEQEFRHEIERGDIDCVQAVNDVVIVTVVGAGIQNTPGVAGELFGALGDKGLNVIAIAQGGSECSTSLIVTTDDADKSVQAIHKLIVE